MHIYKIALILKIFLTLPVIGAEKAQLKNLALTFLEKNNERDDLLKLYLQERKNKAQEILKQQATVPSPSSPHTPRSPSATKQALSKVYYNQQAHTVVLENNNEKNEFLALRKNKAQEILKQKSAGSLPPSPHTPRSPNTTQQSMSTAYYNQQAHNNLLKNELAMLLLQETQDKHHASYYELLLKIAHIFKIPIPLSDEIDQYRFIELSKKFSEILLEMLEILHK